jgi:phosphoglycerate dehydrogenase-like enzyme
LQRFELEICVCDPTLSEQAACGLGVRKVELAELLAWADVVSLHAPALPGTRHMIGRKELAAMRDGTWLVNTARGWLVDHEALEAELASRRLNAFIDTPLPDPLPPESVLYDLENVVLTPHMAGAQGNELWRMSTLEIEEIERFLAGKPALYPVREADLERIA